MTFYFLLLYLALKSLASNSSMCSNLGVIFDQYTPKTLKKKCRIAFFHLSNIIKITIILPQ